MFDMVITTTEENCNFNSLSEMQVIEMLANHFATEAVVSVTIVPVKESKSSPGGITL